METYVALLRGINVGGNRRIKMEALKEMFYELDAKDVRTYIQSGNVVFLHSEIDSDQLADKISKRIKKYFGLEVPILIKTQRQWKQIVLNNPYPKQTIHLHVTFLSELVNHTFDEELFLPDEFSLQGDIVYLVCPKGYSNTKLNNTFFEKKLKVVATTRNWKSINEILNLF